jgi:hypothetical protein
VAGIAVTAVARVMPTIVFIFPFAVSAAENLPQTPIIYSQANTMPLFIET